MRFVIGLTVVGAASLSSGLLLTFIGSALGLRSRHHGHGVTQLGEVLATCGLAVGAAVIAMLAFDLAGWMGRRRSAAGAPATGRAARQPPPVRRPSAVRQDAGGTWSPIPAYVWTPDAQEEPQSVGGWNVGRHDSAAHRQDRWAPDNPDGWAPDSQVAWAPDNPDGWAPDTQVGWAPDNRDGWSSDGDNGWAAAEQAGWGNGPQQQWSPLGREGWPRYAENDWAPPGQDGWVSPEPDGWSPGQEGWDPVADGDWAVTGHDAWDSAGQSEWGNGGQQRWGPAGQYSWPRDAQDGWAAGGQGDWIQPDGQGDWAPAGQDGWAGHPGWDTAGHGDVPAAPPLAPSATRAAEPATGATEPAARAAGPAAEALRPPPKPEPFSVWEPVVKKKIAEPGTGPSEESTPVGAGPSATAEPLSADTQEKLEKIRDLYLTAEAIGEEALVKHFDQLSRMQRSLISEFFEEAGLGPHGTPAPLAGETGAASAPGGGTASQEARSDGASAADRVKSGWRAAVSRRHSRAPASSRPAAPPPPR